MKTLRSTVMFAILLFISAATYAAEPTVSLTVTPVEVGKGGAATLSWTSTNATTCAPSGGWSGAIGTSGSQTVYNIASNQTFMLTCVGATPRVSASVTVAVAAHVVGLNVQQHAGTFDAAGQAFTKELGAHSIRLGYNHGNYDFGVNWAAQNGTSVVFMLGYGAGCDAKTPAGRQCYADRSAQLVQTYGSKVEYYEVWNEWNGGFGLGCDWKTPPCNDGAVYTDLLCKTYKAIKAVRPSAKVAGGVIAGANERFLTGMLDAGAGKCMDVVSLHYYPYRQNLPGHVAADAPGAVGAQSVIDILTARENLVRQKAGRTIPIILTEVGVHGQDERQAADFLTALYNKAKAVPFIEGIWWFQLEDTRKGTFGLLRNNNTKKPAFESFKAAAKR